MIAAIVQARCSSKRLPRKVLAGIRAGDEVRPMLELQLERVRRAKTLDLVIVATSTEPEDDAIAELCDRLDVPCHRGSLDDVLDRMHAAATAVGATHVVRLTGDCPLVDPVLVDRCVTEHLDGGFDVTTNALPGERTWPDGLDVEVVRAGALEEAWRSAEHPAEREHVTPWLYANRDRFRIGSVRADADLSARRWTVDHPEDLELVRAVFEALYASDPAFGTAKVLAFLDGNRRYDASRSLLERALGSIPLGAQTFSKSPTQYPTGVSPHFLVRGEGARVRDVDGNEYVDFVNGLAAVLLGYRDPDVDAAVREQLESGITFTLSHPLEVELAEALCEVIPCAERVRFAKNGSDATAGAIRVARAHTGRDRVAVCGYHGWHDWYIGSTTRDAGVPRAVRELTHAFPYGDAQALEELLARESGGFAAVILEPMNATWPPDGYLERVAELTRAHGALLVFDETITGFRFALGGAQELFGVTPDLATFGKGLANGLPLSCVVGRADVMAEMERVFFSSTFGGETLSLAAAMAVLEKLRREPVLETIHARGEQLLARARKAIEESGGEDFLGLSGHPAWSFLTVRDAGGSKAHELRTLFLQEVFARGVLTLGTHNLSYAHTERDVDLIGDVYDEVFALLAESVREGRVRERLRCEPLEPLFRVR